MRNDIIYYVMIDRFSNGTTDRPVQDDPMDFQGGNLKGLTGKLDYLQELGVTAIMVTPPLGNSPKGYHGYWAKDFYSIDPHFGSLDDFKRFIKQAHQRGIKVIMDLILNHTGSDHPWLQDEYRRGWFHSYRSIQNWWDQEEVEKGWLGDLPDLNHDHPETRQFLKDMALWWIREMQVDGFRLDAARHVPRDFWIELTALIHAEFPDFYFIGEVWDSNQQYLDSYYASGIQGLFHYSLYGPILNSFAKSGSMAQLRYQMERDLSHPNRDFNGIFIDNHDNPRFMTAAGDYKERRVKMAMVFLMTYPAIPILYYGTEIGMEGGHDPDCRRYMEWERVKDSTLLPFFREIIHWRTDSGLHGGDLNILHSDEHVMVYERRAEQKRYIVVLNNDLAGKKVSLDLKEYEELVPVLMNKKDRYNPEDSFLRIEGLEAQIYELKIDEAAAAA